jgi:type I restriction enzyme, S subunit
MSEWSEIALGDLFTSSTPGEWGDELQGSGEGIFVLRSTNFTDSGRVDYASVVRRGISTAKLLKCQLKRGDILLEKSGGGPDQPVGRVVLFDGGDGGTYACSNLIQRLVVGASYDPTFVLYRMLQGYTDGLTTRYEQQTTGIRNLKLTDLLSEKLLVPSLPEQRKIARILSTLDDLIERTEALIAKYRAIKQGLMHDLLTRGVDASGRLRPPREEAPGLYRESAVGWVPREWEVVRAESLCDSVGEIRAGFYGTIRG